MTGRERAALVIDDDEAVRRYLSYLVGRRGYVVVECCDGEEGVAAFRQRSFDVVFTDVAMPGKDGVEAIMQMKEMGRAARMVAVSGAEGRGRLLEIAMKLGADAAVMKPFTPEDIDGVLSEAEEIAAVLIPKVGGPQGRGDG